MAQRVGYLENNIEYKEGPFVIVNANGWRIECEMKGHHCPVLSDWSVYAYWKAYSGQEMHKSNIEEKMVRICDALNQLVRDGIIVLQGRVWVHPQFAL